MILLNPLIYSKLFYALWTLTVVFYKADMNELNRFSHCRHRWHEKTWHDRYMLITGVILTIAIYIYNVKPHSKIYIYICVNFMKNTFSEVVPVQEPLSQT